MPSTTRGLRVGLGLACLSGLAVVVGLSWWVGWLGPEKHFEWDLASIFGTALGTTLLALATGALAFLTARDVSATQALAHLGRVEQEDRERPIVVVQSVNFSGSWNAGDIMVVLVNIGLGPALRVWLEGRYAVLAIRRSTRS